MTKFLPSARNGRDNITVLNGSDVTRSALDLVVLLPDWDQAIVQWGAAWDGHLIMFATSFLLLILSAVSIGVRFFRNMLRIQIVLHILLLIVVLGVLRFAFFLVDPYGFQHKLSGVATHLFVQSVNPLVCASYGFVQMIVAKVTGIEIGNMKLHSQTSVYLVLVACFLCMATVHGLVVIDHTLKAILLLDNCVFVIWMMVMCVTFICRGFRLSQYALEAKQAREEFLLRQRRSKTPVPLTKSEACFNWLAQTSRLLCRRVRTWCLSVENNYDLHFRYKVSQSNLVHTRQTCCLDNYEEIQTCHDQMKHKKRSHESQKNEEIVTYSPKEKAVMLKSSSLEADYTERTFCRNCKHCTDDESCKRSWTKNGFDVKRKRKNQLTPKPSRENDTDSSSSINEFVESDHSICERANPSVKNITIFNQPWTECDQHSTVSETSVRRKLSLPIRKSLQNEMQNNSCGEEMLPTNYNGCLTRSCNNSQPSLASEKSGSECEVPLVLFKTKHKLQNGCNADRSFQRKDGKLIKMCDQNNEPKQSTESEHERFHKTWEDFHVTPKTKSPNPQHKSLQLERTFEDECDSSCDSDSKYCEIMFASKNSPGSDGTDHKQIDPCGNRVKKKHHSVREHSFDSNCETDKSVDKDSRVCSVRFKRTFSRKRNGSKTLNAEYNNFCPWNSYCGCHRTVECAESRHRRHGEHVPKKTTTQYSLMKLKELEKKHPSQNIQSKVDLHEDTVPRRPYVVDGTISNVERKKELHGDQGCKSANLSKCQTANIKTTAFKFRRSQKTDNKGNISTCLGARCFSWRPAAGGFLCCDNYHSDLDISSQDSDDPPSSDDGYIADNEHPQSPFLPLRTAQSYLSTISRLPMQLHVQHLLPQLVPFTSHLRLQHEKHLHRGLSANTNMTHSETTFTLLPDNELDVENHRRATTHQHVPSSSSSFSSLGASFPGRETKGHDGFCETNPQGLSTIKRVQTLKQISHLRSPEAGSSSSDEYLTDLFANESVQLQHSLDDLQGDEPRACEHARAHAQNHTPVDLIRIRNAGMVGRVVQGMYVLTFVHMFLCLLQLYKAFGRYGVLWSGGRSGGAGGTYRVVSPSAWPWLTFQSLCRLTEVASGYVTLGILFVVLRHRSRRRK